MSRTKVVRKARSIDTDPMYGSKLISKIINCAMYDGKKDVAMKVVYGALESVQNFAAEEYKKSHPDGKDTPSNQEVIVWFVEEVINKISPSVEIKSRRIGGANYQIPMSITAKRRLVLSIKWLIDGARTRKERGMSAKLFSELRDAIQDKGEAVKKRDTVHKTAESNKAFAHYGANR